MLAFGADETAGGNGDAERRRRRRRRKTRSSQAAVPDVGEEEPKDTPPVTAGRNDEGSNTNKRGEDGANKSWLEYYLSADHEVGGDAAIATEGGPGDDDARIPADAEKEASSTVELQPNQDGVKCGSETAPESQNSIGGGGKQAGQRRRRRRRRQGAATTSTATSVVEEETGDQDHTAEGNDDQTLPSVEEKSRGTKTSIHAEPSEEISAMELNTPAGSGGRVMKIRRRRKRRTRENATNSSNVEPGISGEDEKASPVNVDASVSELHAEWLSHFSTGNGHEDDADMPSDGDATSALTQDLTAAVESADKAEEAPALEDGTEKFSVSSEEIDDEEVEDEQDATVSDFGGSGDETEYESSSNNDSEGKASSQEIGNREVGDEQDDSASERGSDDDEAGDESYSDNDSEGEDSGQEAEESESSEDISGQMETKMGGKQSEKNELDVEASSYGVLVDEAGDEDSEASANEDDVRNLENVTPEGTRNDSSATESSDKESDEEENEDDEEIESGVANEDEPREYVVESDEEKIKEEEESQASSEAETYPPKETSNDGDELSSKTGEEARPLVEMSASADSPRATEVEEEEDGVDSSNFAADGADQESNEHNETTEQCSEEVKRDAGIEGVDVDVQEEDGATKITVSVVTWNLAEASPSEDEAKFIRRFRKAHPSMSSQEGRRKGSDIVLIGGQETEDIKPRRAEGNRSRQLRTLVIKMLGKEYVPIAIHSLGGVQFCLCVRREILNEIELCSIADVTCGIGNVFHNKGAICAYVQIKARNKEDEPSTRRQKSVKMLFVAAHMAAHVKNVDARNEDFWRIASELEAKAPPRFLRPKSPREQSLVNAEEGEGSYLMDSMDHVFFCGDLNYRIDLPREITQYTVMQITECLQKGDETEADKLRLSLLRHDQLSRVMSDGAAFPGFSEGKITFLPTFKFDKGTKSYDTSHKQRVPAFTDRILFRPLGVRVLEYRSEVDATHSDHRPVSGTFLVDIQGKNLPEQSRRQKSKQRSRRKRSRPHTSTDQ